MATPMQQPSPISGTTPTTGSVQNVNSLGLKSSELMPAVLYGHRCSQSLQDSAGLSIASFEGFSEAGPTLHCDCKLTIILTPRIVRHERTALRQYV